MSEPGHMTRRSSYTRIVTGALVVSALLAIWPLQKWIDTQDNGSRQLEDVAFMPAGPDLRRLSLGYEGLLADIYWTRVVQYFGRRRIEPNPHYDLLGRLLSDTVDLDPHLLIAYRFGAIFLAEKPPQGAGQPEQALELLRKGIVANPGYWRLWEDLGFIYYWDMKDYSAAARAFEAGSNVPGAMSWMKALAAKVSAEGGQLQTSRMLWTQVYQDAENESIKKSAVEHLKAIDAQEAIERLNDLLDKYRHQEGKPANSFGDLVAVGYLRGIPLDPSGVPFEIGPDGTAVLSANSKVDESLMQ
jgi:hypothetical protein